MSRSDWISLLSLLIGIPGFLLILASEKYAIFFLVVTIVVVIAIAARIIRKLLKSPPFIMKSVDVYLEIHDTNGALATLKKEYQVVPMFEHLQEMSHRNIAADGAIENLCWNGTPIPAKQIETIMGEHLITIKFPGPLKRRKQFAGCLSYDAKDSFSSTQESLFYVVDFPAKKVNITINFPAGRVAKTAHGYRVAGSGKELLGTQPVLDGNVRTIKLELKSPRVGDEYEIAFGW